MNLNPQPVLQSGVIYSADNGELICLECAGLSAKYTGRDRSGQPVTAIPYEETVAWFAEFQKPISCEAGCTKYLLPDQSPNRKS